ncbi:nucleotide-binding universal stress UspA family protein [Bacillus mesophilus]|uniref:Universal stress protein n=1 Tax=Bacillus mesophilus TaxID=1808955 RepID=A0A6M0QD65_9BACI|nr:universal stress protein [Bacillus mesophilus]MBM7662911.1 nucleotide-binding universal stress UspA family protein [Bacillus mesophilus]NEY73500.1 universal stress protein [Bacillus mesophilus]
MMNKPSKILVAYDGSELSKKALEYAKEMVANNENARLEVVSVMEVSAYPNTFDPYLYIEIKKNAQEAANTRLVEVRELLEQIPNHTDVEVLEGNPALKIVRYAEEQNVDLIVMGSRGLGRIKEFFLGSVSHNVVQMAKCPVFIIK